MMIFVRLPLRSESNYRTLSHNCSNPFVFNKKLFNTINMKSIFIGLVIAVSTLTASTAKSTQSNVSIKEFVSSYLQMKNAFTQDNSTGAADAGEKMEVAFKNFDKSALTPVQKKTFEDVEADAKEHAEHIGKNGGNIAHQREHFVLLSNCLLYTSPSP